MDITSHIAETVVERRIMETQRTRTYTLTLTREELNMLRGLHFRLHNNRFETVQKALGFYTTGYALSDGPAGYDRYDAFLQRIWNHSNQFNQEAE